MFTFFASPHSAKSVLEVLFFSLMSVAQAIEKAEANVAWMEANYQPIWSWLKQQNQVNKYKKKINK